MNYVLFWGVDLIFLKVKLNTAEYMHDTCFPTFQSTKLKYFLPSALQPTVVFACVHREA